MKVAVSIPDPLFETAERLADREKLSRSALYARALASFVASHRAGDIRARLDAVYGKEPAKLDPLLDALQSEALEEPW